MQLFKEIEPQIMDLVTVCLSGLLFYVSDSEPDVSETRL